MKYETFSLKDKSEVESFESLLNEYITDRAQFSPCHISLVSVYESLQAEENGGRVFTAILDITINFMLLWTDAIKVGSIWNQYFTQGKLVGGSVLDSRDKFFGKMDIHRFNSSFVLRYRALWDKLMGFLILYHAPEKYDSFCCAKSRKRSFVKLAKGIPELTDEYIKNVEELISRFDAEFRTPEAHGTGSLRKYSFTMESIHNNPQIELVEFWNAINKEIEKIGMKFNKQK
jgi:hypothetical protein